MTAAMRASYAMITDAVTQKYGIKETHTRLSNTCARCSNKILSGYILLKNKKPICMLCVPRSMADHLPETAAKWDTQKLLSMLAGTRDQKIDALVASYAFGITQDSWGYFNYHQTFTDPALFHSKLNCLSWEGNEFEDILLRLLAKTQLCILFLNLKKNELLFSITPDVDPNTALSALNFLPYVHAELNEKIQWLNQWKETQDSQLKQRVLKELNALGEADFSDPKTEAAIRESAEILLDTFKAEDFKAIIAYINRVTDIALETKNKSIMARQLATYAHQPDSATRLYSQLPPNHKKLVDALIWQRHMVPVEDIEKLTNLKLTEIDKTRYDRRPEIKREYKDLLLNKSDYYGRRSNIQLAPWFISFLKPVVKRPKEATLIGLEDPPRKSRVIPFQPETLNLAPTLETLYFQNMLSTKKNGTPTAAALRQLQATANYPEFFPDHPNLAYERSNLIFTLMTLLAKPATPSADPEKVTKKWLDTIFYPHTASRHRKASDNTPLPPPWKSVLFLKHIKGTDALCSEKEAAYNTSILKKIITSLPDQKWVTFENISTSLLYNDIHLEIPYNFYGAYTTHITTWGSRDRLYVEKIPELLFERPFLQTMFLLMAAIGLLEIAVENPQTSSPYTFNNDGYLCPGDGLVAIRTTPLAKWYFENKKLDIFTTKQEGTITLDNRRLLIRLSGHNPLLTTVLDKHAEKITRDTYLFTPAKFLQGCKTTADISMQIKSIKSVLPSDLPPIWEQFFENVQSRISPLKKCPYTVFKINNAPELEKYFHTDPVLKSLVLKAEGGHIMVESAKQKQLQAHLTKLGYFTASK